MAFAVGQKVPVALQAEATSWRNKSPQGVKQLISAVVGNDRGQFVVQLSSQIALCLDDEEGVRQTHREALLVGLKVLLGELAGFPRRLDPRGRS
jgi:hypothetical protein